MAKSFYTVLGLRKVKKLIYVIYKHKYNIRFFLYNLIIMEKVWWMWQKWNFSLMFIFEEWKKVNFFFWSGWSWMKDDQWKMIWLTRNERIKVLLLLLWKKKTFCQWHVFMVWMKKEFPVFTDAPLTMNFQVGSYLHRIGQDIYMIQLVISATPLST